LKPTAHVAASAIVSASLYCFSKSPLIAGVSFLCGFLIDIDHIFDYIREYGLRANVKEFFRIFHETRFRKLFLIFHAWEWVPCLFVLAGNLEWNGLILGIGIGMFQHLLLDQIDNGFTAGGYFIVYRTIKRFSMEDIVLEAVVQRKREQKLG
jgi:hypothetical protein